MHLNNVFQGNHKYTSKKWHYLFSYYRTWNCFIIIIIYCIASIGSARTEINKRKKKRRSCFLHRDQMVQTSCLEYTTRGTSSRVSHHWGHRHFPLQSAKLSDSVSLAVSNSSPGKEAPHWTCCTWGRLLFQPGAFRFFWASFLFLSSSLTNQKNRKKGKITH